MEWVTVMTLADGSRVESSLPSLGETAASLAGRTYRVLRPDGSTRVFATLSLILDHLRDHYGPDGPTPVVGRERWASPPVVTGSHERSSPMMRRQPGRV
jgi:secreted protein with Ig-like and vWFA domain